MIGNTLGYSAVTCFMLLSSSCATLKGMHVPAPESPPAARTKPATKQESGRSMPSGGSPAAPFVLGPESPSDIATGAGPAVVALLGQAQEEQTSNKTDQAIATLERALGIEPRNPRLYRQLALLHMSKGDAVEAESLAQKSNSLAGDDRRLQARNWLLIGKARSEQGDSAGAADALRRARNLSNGLPAGQ